MNVISSIFYVSRHWSGSKHLSKNDLNNQQICYKFVQFGTRAIKSVLNICIISLTQMSWRAMADIWNSSRCLCLDMKAKFLPCNEVPELQLTWASRSPSCSPALCRGGSSKLRGVWTCLQSMLAQGSAMPMQLHISRSERLLCVST